MVTLPWYPTDCQWWKCPDSTDPGIGRLGGFDGGLKIMMVKVQEQVLRSTMVLVVVLGVWRHGLYNGDSTKGQPYGDAALSHLLGGSGGVGVIPEPVELVEVPLN